MKKSKKLISYIIVLSMVFGLVGCGKDERSEELKYVFAKEENFDRITGSYINGLYVAGDTVFYSEIVSDGASSGDAIATSGDAMSGSVVFYKKSVDGGEAEKLASYSPSETGP